MVLIETYKDNYKADWNNFVDSSKNSTFLFNRDFMDYHSDRFEDFSLMVYEKSELIALLPLNIIEDKNLIAIHYKVICHTYDKVVLYFVK